MLKYDRNTLHGNAEVEDYVQTKSVLRNRMPWISPRPCWDVSPTQSTAFCWRTAILSYASCHWRTSLAAAVLWPVKVIERVPGKFVAEPEPLWLTRG
eukprot:3059445-Amphidinium_carterae.1